RDTSEGGAGGGHEPYVQESSDKRGGALEDYYLVPVGPALQAASTRLLFDEHLHHPPDLGLADLELNLAVELDELLEPRLRNISREECVLGKSGRRRAVARRVLVEEGVVEAHTTHQVERCLELLLRLPREGDDDI